MNEALYQSLSKKAASQMPKDRLNPYDYKLYMEILAELIVRECIERVRAQYTSARDLHLRTEREQGIVECGVASVIALEELVQESTDRWYKENILRDEE